MKENYIFFLLLCVLPLSFVIYKCFLKPNTMSPELPPGPSPWPIIGNILHLLQNKPHISLAQLAQIHGPIISLRLGSQLVVVGSSVTAAAEILKNHDRLLSGRTVPEASPSKNPATTHLNMTWADCTDQWKFLRTICRKELFSVKPIEHQSGLREEKVMELIEFLQRKEGQVVQITDVIFATVFNMISNILVSQDLISLEDQKEGEGMKEIARSFIDAASTPNLSDFYPILSRYDIQGLKKKSAVLLGKICGLWEPIIKERREGKGTSNLKGQGDFVDFLLGNEFTNDQINYLIQELLVAGSDTTTSTIEWTMAELMKNQQAMKKVCNELERGINNKIVRESDLSRLPLLNSCIKEVLRLHPPAPFLIPRRALETCKVMNYTIPKDSQVLVNVWAIGRDPQTWDEPLEFRPERFLETRMDFQSNDFGWIPFGAGSRICPGLPMASKQVALILASLINSFRWSLPHDMEPSELNMEEKVGITLQKEKPLTLIPTVKRRLVGCVTYVRIVNWLNCFYLFIDR